MASSAPFDVGTLIEATPGVSGGRPCLAGTGMPVLQVAVLYLEGATAAEILDRYRHLDLARIHAGIAYYLANKAGFDAELRVERDAYERAVAEQQARAARTSA